MNFTVLCRSVLAEMFRAHDQNVNPRATDRNVVETPFRRLRSQALPLHMPAQRDQPLRSNVDV